MLAWTKQNTMQRAMRTVLEWPQSHVTSKHHTHYDNKETEPQQKHRLGTVSKILLGGLNRFPISPSASIMAQNIQLFGPREGFLTHQWILRQVPIFVNGDQIIVHFIESQSGLLPPFLEVWPLELI